MTTTDTALSERAKKFDDIQDAIEEVHYRFRCFTSTADMVNRASHLIALSDAISDLSSWHDSVDDHGRLGWERDDDQVGLEMAP
jgi:hypothetical protein